ncbi:MAG TPA: hypothetical protein VK480_03440 [Solirubrobacterales bacterium]|nr:hypothetical protein [Solirubrobacterales bacterium]
MSRILKAIGLAIGAMAAMSAFLASAAHAETGALTAEQFPAFVTGEKVNVGPTFDIGAGKTVTCATSDFDATLEGPADPATFIPTYNGCTSEPGAVPVTVTTNGCDYRFGFTAPGTTGDLMTTGRLRAAVVCPEGQSIQIHLYANAAEHAGNNPFCTYDILPQAPVAAGVYHNVPGFPADVTATVQATFTARNTLGPAFICGAEANEHLPITLTGSYTLKAFEDINGVEGGQIGLHVGSAD